MPLSALCDMLQTSAPVPTSPDQTHKKPAQPSPQLHRACAGNTRCQWQLWHHTQHRHRSHSGVAVACTRAGSVPQLHCRRQMQEWSAAAACTRVLFTTQTAISRAWACTCQQRCPLAQWMLKQTCITQRANASCCNPTCMACHPSLVHAVCQMGTTHTQLTTQSLTISAKSTTGDHTLNNQTSSTNTLLLCQQ